MFFLAKKKIRGCFKRSHYLFVFVVYLGWTCFFFLYKVILKILDLLKNCQVHDFSILFLADVNQAENEGCTPLFMGELFIFF